MARWFCLVVAIALFGCAGRTREVDGADDPWIDDLPETGPVETGQPPTEAGVADAPEQPLVDDACRDLAAAHCARRNECVPWSAETQGVDLEGCVSSFLARTMCTRSLSAKGTSRSLDDIRSCGGAIRTATCAAFREHFSTKRLLPACAPKAGALPDGAVCWSAWQCAGAYCGSDRERTDGCGRCRAPRAEGAACERDEECGYDAVCSRAKVCTRLGELGDRCDDNRPCLVSWTCSRGTCAPRVETAGAECNSQLQNCAQSQMLACNSKRKVCSRLKFAKPGEPCGFDDAGDFVSCAAGASCSPGDTRTKCIPWVAPGGACDPSAGRHCTPPEECRVGTCQMPDSSTCL
jgi:hypothetical protein